MGFRSDIKLVGMPDFEGCVSISVVVAGSFQYLSTVEAVPIGKGSSFAARRCH